MNNSNEEKQITCPYCAELIPKESVKCQHCESILEDITKENSIINKSEITEKDSQKIKKDIPQKNPDQFFKKLWVRILLASILLIIAGYFLISNYLDANKKEAASSGYEENQALVDENDDNYLQEEVDTMEDVVYEEEKDDIFYVNVRPGSSLFLRKTPGSKGKPDSDIVEKIERNSEITLIDNYDNSVKEDGFIWWEFYNPSSGKEGWAASEFVSKEFLQTYEITDYIGISRKDFIEKFQMPDSEGGYQDSKEMYYEDLSLSLIYNPYSDNEEIFGFFMFEDCEFVFYGEYLLGKTFKEIENIYGNPDYSGFFEMTGNYIIMYEDMDSRLSMHADSNNGTIHTVDYFIKY